MHGGLFMSVHTKQDIIDTTLMLAAKKPVNKISIKTLCEECGITRNTFYYYFHDIFDVFDTILNEQISRLENASPEEYDTILFDVIGKVLQYKKVWINFYKAVGHDRLSTYVSTHLHKMFVDYLRVKAAEESFSELDLAIISTFFEEALVGVLIRWLTGSGYSTSEEMTMIAHRIQVLFDGSIALMLENSKKSPDKNNER